MRIREALAGNDDLPPAFGIPLADRIRQHLPFNWTAFRDLRQDDVALLLQAPYQRLLEALPFEQYISDSSVRRSFLQGVREHKDPLVRLELSGTSQTLSPSLRRHRAELFPDDRLTYPDGMQESLCKTVWDTQIAEDSATLQLTASGKHLPLTYGQLTALAARPLTHASGNWPLRALDLKIL